MSNVVWTRRGAYRLQYDQSRQQRPHGIWMDHAGTQNLNVLHGKLMAALTLPPLHFPHVSPPDRACLGKKALFFDDITSMETQNETAHGFVQTNPVRPSVRPGIAVEDGMASMRNSKQFGAWLNLSGCGHSINLRVPLHSYVYRRH